MLNVNCEDLLKWHRNVPWISKYLYVHCLHLIDPGKLSPNYILQKIDAYMVQIRHQLFVQSKRYANIPILKESLKASQVNTTSRNPHNWKTLRPHSTNTETSQRRFKTALEMTLRKLSSTRFWNDFRNCLISLQKGNSDDFNWQY